MTEHDLGDVAALAAGLLDPGDHPAVMAHLAGCASCRGELTQLRSINAELRAVPPEMFLDGAASELTMRRVMRQVGIDDRRAPRRLHRVGRVLAAACAAAVLVGMGAVAGRISAPPAEVGALSGPDLNGPAAVVARGSADWAGQQVRLNARLSPRAGWVQVAATVAGLPSGHRCTLVLVAADGSVRSVAEWIVGGAGQEQGAQLSGSVILDPALIRAIAVRDADGSVPISVPVT